MIDYFRIIIILFIYLYLIYLVTSYVIKGNNIFKGNKNIFNRILLTYLLVSIVFFGGNNKHSNKNEYQELSNFNLQEVKYYKKNHVLSKNFFYSIKFKHSYVEKEGEFSPISDKLYINGFISDILLSDIKPYYYTENNRFNVELNFKVTYKILGIPMYKKRYEYNKY